MQKEGLGHLGFTESYGLGFSLLSDADLFGFALLFGLWGYVWFGDGMFHCSTPYDKPY